ncbi:SDR family NAD(P)-dependent oxidoreductase [Amorphus orientalis]|uniref:NAD(P)-dependent dehydrogenase (Short-subunit alcohol dehydrogenase family) n=1 Tax=Amorphus orientalis TaxID=649198 RepID=A0AAE4AVP9_9HYPH|nr:SDR family oxidoreductase [Amorphus orientalis]MDQ0316889.1 NAD(P)-dependent dehydrogenase (short-subunit alcohol dehydrogenase family) [Amorphus orientalis]
MSGRDGGRRIAVLGGAGGIGRVLVADLIARGDEAIVLDLPASLERHPLETRTIGIDVHDEASIAAAVKELAEAAPNIDGFVNLVGYNNRIQPLAETATDYFDDIIAVNLRGLFLATKAILPLLSDGAGAVLLASGLGQYIRPGFGSYAASKAGVIALGKTFALETAPRLRVNIVAPGAVDTAFLRGGTGRSDESAEPDIPVDAYAANLPLKRLAQPEDVVGPIRFLLGPDSRYMTGQVLWVNGGAYMP